MAASPVGTSRREVLAGALGLTMAAGIPAAAASRRKQQTTENAMTKPSIVFAHGLWADGSCFQKLIPTL
jgi:hypothetical protein